MRIYRTIAWYLIASLLVLAGATVASLSASRNSQSNQSQCVLCHTDVKGLIRLSWEVEKVKSKPAQSAETAGEGYGGPLAPLELYEKVYVNPSILDSDHGRIACEECHGGNPDDTNWQTAHQGVVQDPSFPDPGPACGQCHEEISAGAQHSLHYTLGPMYAAIEQRASVSKPEVMNIVRQACERHCGTCHASCGQCHISRPDYVKGGFLSGHNVSSPPMETVCAGCHGGRVAGEYTGAKQDYTADVHYSNCFVCHVGTDTQGLPYYKCKDTRMLFKIGRNPRKSARRPYNYAVLRHAPVAPTLFDAYVNGALDNFSVQPTWKLDAPHSIQRRTPQNQSCNACHVHGELFLGVNDMADWERDANSGVIVPLAIIPQPVKEDLK